MYIITLLLYTFKSRQEFTKSRVRRKQRCIQIRVSPVHNAPINRVKTQYIVTSCEIVCRINNSLKALYRDDGKAMCPNL